MHTGAQAPVPPHGPPGTAPPPSSASRPQPRWRRPEPGQAKLHRHRPATAHEEEHVYVLTLRLSPALHDALNALRTRYFPPERLKVPAHLTLFHALPHSELDSVCATAADVARRTRPFEVTTGGAFLLGKNGVAISPAQGTDEGARVHAELREKWAHFLSKQDAKGFKAHWTIQNKVDDEEKVKAAYAELRAWAEEHGAKGEANGLVLWRYNRGRWVFEREFVFGEAEARQQDGR
ncbi:hypothetical protein JCM10450v2_002304 [Rhodotorula kratochvilovae]